MAFDAGRVELVKEAEDAKIPVPPAARDALRVAASSVDERERVGEVFGFRRGLGGFC